MPKNAEDIVIALRNVATRLNDRDLDAIIHDIGADLETLAKAKSLMMLGVTVDAAFAAYQANLISGDVLINIIAKAIPEPPSVEIVDGTSAIPESLIDRS
jgi:hypothetical protein